MQCALCLQFRHPTCWEPPPRGHIEELPDNWKCGQCNSNARPKGKRRQPQANMRRKRARKQLPTIVGRDEVVVFFISDLQMGKKTSSYNMAVCTQRMREFTVKGLEQVCMTVCTQCVSRTVYVCPFGCSRFSSLSFSVHFLFPIFAWMSVQCLMRKGGHPHQGWDAHQKGACVAAWRHC